MILYNGMQSHILSCTHVWYKKVTNPCAFYLKYVLLLILFSFPSGFQWDVVRAMELTDLGVILLLLRKMRLLTLPEFVVWPPDWRFDKFNSVMAVSLLLAEAVESEFLDGRAGREH